jgi:hypothetical protein
MMDQPQYDSQKKQGHPVLNRRTSSMSKRPDARRSLWSFYQNRVPVIGCITYSTTKKLVHNLKILNM